MEVLVNFNANHCPSKLISGPNKTFKLNYRFLFVLAKIEMGLIM